MKTKIKKLILLSIVLLMAVVQTSARKPKYEIKLTENGKKIFAEYTKMLEDLKKEVVKELPKVDAKLKEDFEKARAAVSALKEPKEGSPVKELKAYKEAKEISEERVMAASRAMIKSLDTFLSGDKLDAKLIKIKILTHGNPEALAEFAQQSAKHKALLDKLFADPALMKQIVIANGANGGEYGETMQIYTSILAKSEKARKPGILQRLALGMAIHMPWAPEQERGAVPGIVYRTRSNIDQVKRFLHYQKAFEDKELDPHFKDMTTWECRFIGNGQYSDEDMAWVRMMMRNFRPDIIKLKDHKWRYSKFIKSDVPYTSTKNDPSLGTPAQEHICLGGICGRRAFLGRLMTRAFGIPTRASTQTGHGAMCRWTPDGWVVNLGAWWSMAWCGPQGGMDFYLDSHARKNRVEYMKVLRAQWIGDTLNQEDVSIRHYGKGGGFWDGVGFYKKRLIFEKAQKDKKESELAKLSAEEARLLGESDKILGNKDKIVEIKIPEEFKKVKIDKDGTITVPAAAISRPKNNTAKVLFQEVWGGGGMQIHYQRLGNRPEILRYTVEAPKAGKYKLSLNVCTVAQKYEVIARLNRRTIVNILLPFTKGYWKQTESKEVELREGRNTFMFTFRSPNRGVTLKEFKLTPVK